jgi:methionyl aminopeptidase
MSITSEEDLEGLQRIGRIVARVLREMAASVRPGMTTAELDALGAGLLAEHGARSAPQLVYDFPGANCISVDEEVVHGIPGARVIRSGDLVKIDVTAELGGYIADAATTVAVAPVSEAKRRLKACAEAALRQALTVARAGRRVSDIGQAVEAEVQRQGFQVIPELCGHGVGRTIHEDPNVPNYADPRQRDRLTDGLVITIEPIIAARSNRVVTADDGWTLRTVDGSPAAHAEHTIVITKGRPLVITAA